MRTALLIGVFFAVGCHSVTLDPRKPEFWLGGTDDKEVRERLAPLRDSATVDAHARGGEYVACLERYAARHATSSATPSEIAEAADADCALFLAAFERATHDAIKYQWIISTLGTRAVDRADEQAARESEDAAAELRKRGHSRAIKAVIEARPHDAPRARVT